MSPQIHHLRPQRVAGRVPLVQKAPKQALLLNWVHWNRTTKEGGITERSRSGLMTNKNYSHLMHSIMRAVTVWNDRNCQLDEDIPIKVFCVPYSCCKVFGRQFLWYRPVETNKPPTNNAKHRKSAGCFEYIWAQPKTGNSIESLPPLG